MWKFFTFYQPSLQASNLAANSKRFHMQSKICFLWGEITFLRFAVKTQAFGNWLFPRTAYESYEFNMYKQHFWKHCWDSPQICFTKDNYMAILLTFGFLLFWFRCLTLLVMKCFLKWMFLDSLSCCVGCNQHSFLQRHNMKMW